jgi:hypothetical protein
MLVCLSMYASSVSISYTLISIVSRG